MFLQTFAARGGAFEALAIVDRRPPNMDFDITSPVSTRVRMLSANARMQKVFFHLSLPPPLRAVLETKQTDLSMWNNLINENIFPSPSLSAFRVSKFITFALQIKLHLRTVGGRFA